MAKREAWAVEFQFASEHPIEPVEFWRQESQALAHRNKLNGGPGGKHFVTKYVPERQSTEELRKEREHLEEAALRLAEILESWKVRAPSAMTPVSLRWLEAERVRQEKKR